MKAFTGFGDTVVDFDQSLRQRPYESKFVQGVIYQKLVSVFWYELVDFMSN